MQQDMKDRVAMVIGATGEIGQAIASRLAEGGARLALTAADRGVLDVLGGALHASDVLSLRVDPTDPVAVSECVAAVLARYGQIDVLVNNAGDVNAKPLGDLTARDVHAAVDTALLGPFHFIREVTPGMRTSGYGRIVNVSEIGYLGLPNQTNVAAARAGLFGLTRSAALELARCGVTVNIVAKGDIADSAMTDAEREKLAGAIPVKRLGAPDDVARAVAFFAADSARYLTGQTLFVCGGKSVYFSMSV